MVKAVGNRIVRFDGQNEVLRKSVRPFHRICTYRRNDLRALMDQLEEGVLAVCSWLAKYDGTRMVSRPQLVTGNLVGRLESYGRNAPVRETDLPFDSMKSCWRYAAKR